MNSAKLSLKPNARKKYVPQSKSTVVSKNTLEIMSAINRVQTRAYKKALAKKESVETNSAMIVAAIVKVQSKKKPTQKYSLKKPHTGKFKKKAKIVTKKKSCDKKSNNKTNKRKSYNTDNNSNKKKRRMISKSKE